LKGVMTNNPLPIIGVMLYSLIVKLVIPYSPESTQHSKLPPPPIGNSTCDLIG